MAWERIHTAGADEADNPYNVWRYAVPGGWIYVHCNFGVAGTVFVPEPNKVSAEDTEHDDEYDRAYKDGWDAALRTFPPSKVTAGYPKFIVVITDYDGEAVMATHRLFPTQLDADYYLATVHPKMKAVIVQLDKPLYVKEGKS